MYTRLGHKRTKRSITSSFQSLTIEGVLSLESINTFVATQSCVQLYHLSYRALDLQKIISLGVLSNYAIAECSYLAQILPDLSNLSTFQSDVRTVAFARGLSSDGTIYYMLLSTLSELNYSLSRATVS